MSIAHRERRHYDIYSWHASYGWRFEESIVEGCSFLINSQQEYVTPPHEPGECAQYRRDRFDK